MSDTTTAAPVAVVTGGSRGLGLAVARGLAARGWRLVLDARDGTRLRDAAGSLPGGPHHSVPGDVTDASHRRALAEAAHEAGGAVLLVDNASTLANVGEGLPALPRIADLDPDVLRRVLDVNVVAPLALARALLPQLRGAESRGHRGTVVTVSSDAAVEAYPGWGAYAISKAALDHAARVLAAEEPQLAVHAVDPGDLRTRMHQDAFPGEDISDRPEPETVAPALLELVLGVRPSGRSRLADLAGTGVSG